MAELASRHSARIDPGSDPRWDLDESRLHPETISAVFSQCSRRGAWTVAEHVRVRAYMLNATE